MRHRILIVDDDDIVIFIHKMVIGECQAGMEPLAFDNGSAAVEYLDRQHQEFERCLILLDIHMPGMNGWQLLDILEESPFRDKLAVIMVTSSIDAHDQKRSENYSLVHGFISKPLGINNCAQIRTALAS